jgi:hypothetical protein
MLKKTQADRKRPTVAERAEAEREKQRVKVEPLLNELVRKPSLLEGMARDRYKPSQGTRLESDFEP